MFRAHVRGAGAAAEHRQFRYLRAQFDVFGQIQLMIARAFLDMQNLRTSSRRLRVCNATI
jgi:hypothetical protein